MSSNVKRILVYGMVASKTFGGVGTFLTEMNRHMSGNTFEDIWRSRYFPNRDESTYVWKYYFRLRH